MCLNILLLYNGKSSLQGSFALPLRAGNRCDNSPCRFDMLSLSRQSRPTITMLLYRMGFFLVSMSPLFRGACVGQKGDENMGFAGPRRAFAPGFPAASSKMGQQWGRWFFAGRAILARKACCNALQLRTTQGEKHKGRRVLVALCYVQCKESSVPRIIGENGAPRGICFESLELESVHQRRKHTTENKAPFSPATF